MRNITPSNFKTLAFNAHNDYYNYSKTFYINTKNKVTITCPIHGDFQQSPIKHLSGQGCPECGIIRTAEKLNLKGKNTFLKKANETHNNFYSYDKTIYLNSSNKITITCPIHGDFQQLPSCHLSGNGCAKCRGRNKNTPLFIDQANLVHKKYYDYDKTIYVCSRTKVIITCPKHGDFKQSPSSHLSGRGCPECGRGKNKKSNQTIINLANITHNSKYTYEKLNYKNSRTKLIITCPKHGDFLQSKNNHLAGNGCPSCKSSKGEKIISEVLEKLNVEFKTQHKFNDCIYKRKLPYDFAIFINEKVKGLIEFHGEQHFKEIPHFKRRDGKNKLEDIKNRDEIKRKYAVENNIELLIISYNESNNIDELIINFIKKIKNEI